MKKNHVVFFLFLIASLIIIQPFTYAHSKPKNNVLLITIDTLRADRVSCYDPDHVRTPNIDSLAERGITFTRAFAHNPLTLPSHVNILLGTTPLYHGVSDNINFNVTLYFIHQKRRFYLL